MLGTRMLNVLQSCGPGYTIINPKNILKEMVPNKDAETSQEGV